MIYLFLTALYRKNEKRGCEKGKVMIYEKNGVVLDGGYFMYAESERVRQ